MKYLVFLKHLGCVCFIAVLLLFFTPFAIHMPFRFFEMVMTRGGKHLLQEERVSSRYDLSNDGLSVWGGMIKKVKKEELKVGMYVHDLNCGWLGHGFFRRRFMVKNEGDVKKIRESSAIEIYIDTDKGLDANEPGLQEASEELPKPIGEVVPATRPEPDQTSHSQELEVAKRIQSEATQVITSVLSDVRLGKQIEVERVSPVVGKITESILRNQGTLVSLCRIKERDTYTFQHSVSVCTLLVTFCRYMGMSQEVIQEAGIGGMLHDIGKMRVPDHILNKPGKLTDSEFEIMKGHVTLGMDILRQTPGISTTVMQISGEHHERYEGSGYPTKKRAQEISQLGRMAAIVDVYDAITSNRVYHTGMEPSVALQKLFEWSKNHLDEELVQHFIQAIGIYPVGSLVRLESNRLAVVVQQGTAGLLYPVVRLVYDIKRNTRLSPMDEDLSNAESGGDHIVSSESPETWKVNPFDYLTLDLKN
jgi:putative nucleotidyltransferase with HDIG domain